jgi:hypothetical protein
LEEVTVHGNHKVLMEVYDNSVLIVGNPQGILGQQFCGLYYKNILTTVCDNHK